MTNENKGFEVNKKVVAELLKELMNKGESEEVVEDGEKFKVYQFQELQATFSMTDKQKFFGFVFILFGSQLMIANDFILLAYDEEKDDGVVLEDPAFTELVNDYLRLRIRALKEFDF